MLQMYHMPKEDIDKVTRLYDRSEIETRYSVIEDFSLPKSKWTFIENEQAVSVEKRMKSTLKWHLHCVKKPSNDVFLTLQIFIKLHI